MNALLAVFYFFVHVGFMLAPSPVSPNQISVGGSGRCILEFVSGRPTFFESALVYDNAGNKDLPRLFQTRYMFRQIEVAHAGVLLEFGSGGYWPHEFFERTKRLDSGNVNFASMPDKDPYSFAVVSEIELNINVSTVFSGGQASVNWQQKGAFSANRVEHSFFSGFCRASSLPESPYEQRRTSYADPESSNRPIELLPSVHSLDLGRYSASAREEVCFSFTIILTVVLYMSAAIVMSSAISKRNTSHIALAGVFYPSACYCMWHTMEWGIEGCQSWFFFNYLTS